MIKFSKFIIFIFAFLLISSNSLAQETEEQPPTQETRILRHDFWYHLASQPLYAFMQLNLHEGSHALAAVSTGGKIEEFAPYPTKVNGKFFFGRTLLSGDYNETFMLIAPSITDISLFTTSDIILSRIEPESPAAPVFFSIMLWNFIDFTYNWNGSSEYNDVVRFTNKVGTNRVATLVVGDTLAVVGLVRLIDRSLKIFILKQQKPIDTKAQTTVMFFDGQKLNLFGEF